MHSRLNRSTFSSWYRPCFWSSPCPCKDRWSEIATVIARPWLWSTSVEETSVVTPDILSWFFGGIHCS